MQVDVEEKNGAVVVTLNMAPAERAAILDDIKYWDELLADCVGTMPRSILLNRQQRDVRLREILAFLRPMLTEPEVLREDPPRQPPG